MKKILLIEDDAFLVRFYKNKLTKLDFEVEIIESGAQAIERARAFKPNLIITDLAVKDLDGFELIKRLKLDEETKNIPVFVLSNLGMEEDIIKAKKHSIDKYIVKSDTDMKDVIEEIQKFLA